MRIRFFFTILKLRLNKKINKKCQWLQVYASKLLGEYSGSFKMPKRFFGQNVQVENGKSEHHHWILHIRISEKIKL